MTTIKPQSPAGRVMRMLKDAVSAKRLSRAEAAIVYDLLDHPDFPDTLRKDSAIDIPQIIFDERDGATIVVLRHVGGGRSKESKRVHFDTDFEAFQFAMREYGVRFRR